jgi:hypothetical protein
MLRCLLRKVTGREAMSTPSMLHLPVWASISLNSPSMRLLLPAPVRPTTPIFSPPPMDAETCLRTGSPVAYLRA